MKLRTTAWMSVFLTACTPSKQEPVTDAASAPMEAPAPTSSVSTPPPKSSASTPPAMETPPPCDVELPEELEFMECNPKPRTLDYPDCRTYGVKRLENDRGCRPARLSLDVTGYQAISDGLIVKVQWEEGAVPRAKLLLERVEYSLGKNTLKPGMLMGTLVFEKGGPREMLLGVGMLGYTSQKTARRTEEP